ncbi:MAG: hypothetical protein WDO13_08115 [Verrucomicrobiota bacterium]
MRRAITGRFDSLGVPSEPCTYELCDPREYRYLSDWTCNDNAPWLAPFDLPEFVSRSADRHHRR